MKLAGYAALFGIADAAGDVIRKGAFARTIATAQGRPLPLWWQHRPGQRIGAVEMLAEDDRGLRVIARVDGGTRAAAALARREISGLSFGYRARGFRRLHTGPPGGMRLLEDIDLFEISLVADPLQHGARVHLIA